MGRRLGLILGINQYQDAAFRPLQFAETDARGLAQWLVNTRGGNWAPGDLQLVLGAQATRELAVSLISQICLDMAESGDLVFIYFAGHAFLDVTSGEGYLALANTHYQNPTTGLHLATAMKQAIGRCRADNVLLILDCFQTGPIWNMKRTFPYDFKPLPGPALLNSLQQTEGQVLFCSCRGNEQAPEVGEKNLGILVHRMLLGLCGPCIDPATGQVTMQRLSAFLSNSLGEQHRPQIFGQARGRSPLILVGEISAPTVNLHNISPRASTPSPLSATVASSVDVRRPATGPLVMQGAQQATAPVRVPPQVSPPNSGQLSQQISPATFEQLSPIMSPPNSGQLSQQMSPATSGHLSPAMSSTNSGQLSLTVMQQQRLQQSMTLLNAARQLVQAQNLPEALNAVEQALQTVPSNIDALILKGQILGAIGRFQEAMVVVDQVLGVDTNNALVWSMRAALLLNMGRAQESLAAIERSLTLDPNNPETHRMKATIEGNIVSQQYISSHPNQRFGTVTPAKGDTLKAFLIGSGIQILGLVTGTIGAVLLILQPQLPIVVAFTLVSLALAILCVNAARSCYLYGATRLVSTIVVCLAAVGLVGAIYLFEYHSLEARVISNPPLLVSVLFLALWLALAAILPLLAALGGFIASIARGVRKPVQTP